MKKLFGILVLVGVGCQPQTAADTAVAPGRAKTKAAVSTATLPSPFKPADTLTAPMRKLLIQHNLAALWQGTDSPVLEGFFGPDHYRFELALTQVRRDAQNPAFYHVQGKCHYRKNVRSFAGSLVVREVGPLEPPYEFASDDKDAPNQSDSDGSDAGYARYEQQVRQAQPSQVRAELRIQEEKAENSGEFVGEATLLFYTTSHRRLAYLGAPLRAIDSFNNPGHLLIRGTRRNLTTRQIKQFVVADNVFAAAPDVFKDFDIGDRGGEMNPKYAHLGWNEKWENDEWWADAPKPHLSL